MLIDQLYTLNRFVTDAQHIEAMVTLNVAHKIFEGHFPGQPILPGVCQLQIVKELLERSTKQKLLLSEASSCKFLQMIDPTKMPELEVVIQLTIETDALSCNAVIKNGEITFLKMNGRFAIVG